MSFIVKFFTKTIEYLTADIERYKKFYFKKEKSKKWWKVTKDEK